MKMIKNFIENRRIEKELEVIDPTKKNALEGAKEKWVEEVKAEYMEVSKQLADGRRTLIS